MFTYLLILCPLVSSIKRLSGLFSCHVYISRQKTNAKGWIQSTQIHSQNLLRCFTENWQDTSSSLPPTPLLHQCSSPVPWSFQHPTLVWRRTAMDFCCNVLRLWTCIHNVYPLNGQKCPLFLNCLWAIIPLASRQKFHHMLCIKIHNPGCFLCVKWMRTVDNISPRSQSSA